MAQPGEETLNAVDISNKSKAIRTEEANEMHTKNIYLFCVGERIERRRRKKKKR